LRGIALTSSFLSFFFENLGTVRQLPHIILLATHGVLIITKRGEERKGEIYIQNLPIYRICTELRKGTKAYSKIIYHLSFHPIFE
jgi:hypothetical protein